MKLCSFHTLTYLHPVGGEAQLLLVAPQHFGPGPDGRPGQQLVEVGHLVLAVVADQDEHGALAGPDGPLDQRPDAGVELLADHLFGGARALAFPFRFSLLALAVWPLI